MVFDGEVRLLTPGGRRTIVKYDVVAHAEAVEYGADVGVERRCEFLIHVEE